MKAPSVGRAEAMRRTRHHAPDTTHEGLQHRTVVERIRQSSIGLTPNVRRSQLEKLARALADVTNSPDAGTVSEPRLTRTRRMLRHTQLFAPNSATLIGCDLNVRCCLTQRLMSVS